MKRFLRSYLGMQPEVAAGETTSFPSTISALTDDAPHMQGASSRPAPAACAALNASTATTAAMTTQTLTRRCRPQDLTTRGCLAVAPNAMGRVAHLRPCRVLSPPARRLRLLGAVLGPGVEERSTS